MADQVLNPGTVPGYIAERPALSGLVDTSTLTVSEIGDGNLNLVFVCADGDGRRLVLKQALPYVRLVGPDWPMTEARAAREAAAMRVHGGLSPDVCRLLDFDEERHVLALEDLSDHEVFRTRLNADGGFAGVVERLAEYLAEVAFGTSFLGLPPQDFRRRAADAVNPELCELTEDLVFTEPYLGADRNGVRPSVEPLVAKLQADQEWVGAALEMKRSFLTVQEMLLHGDLHSGSVFVRGDGADLSVKVFDPEFACYGPVGFDLGMMWTSMVFAAARSGARGDLARAEAQLRTIPTSWDAFVARLRARWPGRTAPDTYPDSFLDAWLPRILRDSFGFAGCEAARRVIGLAKVSDVESLDDAEYAVAASVVLRLSRVLLVDRATLSPEALVRAGLECLHDGAA